MRCENCGARAPDWRAALDRPDVVRCATCGGWSYVAESAVDPAAVYGREYFEGGEYAGYAGATASHVRNFGRKLDLLLRHTGLPATAVRLLELGCATGEFLRIARGAGVARLLGVEPSSYGREVASRAGMDVAPSVEDALGAIESLRPNLVVAWDVWEHLPRPATTLETVLERCAPDVGVGVSTVDAASWVARARGARWRQFHPPTHLQYPTRDSLRRFFRGRGFAILHHRTFGYFRPLQEYLRAIGIRAPADARSSLWMLPVYLNLWDIQLLIAQRGTG